MSPRRLLYVVTTPVTANVLLRGQLRFMREAGFDVHVAAAPGPELDQVAEREGVTTHQLPLVREMVPRADAQALLATSLLVRRLRPRIVNASTAKAGLIGMLAARIAAVPARVYLLRGLRLETTTGATRRILHQTERLASACANEIICVSESLRRAYLAQGCAPARKVHVLGGGSSNGFDTGRFTPTDGTRAAGRRLRVELGIPEEARVVGFVGRLVRDKGLEELLDALDEVRRERPDVRLLIVGAGFAGDLLDGPLAQRVALRQDVHTVGQVNDLAPYYAAMDLLAFPSHREGFPNVPMEAAAAGLAVVGSDATGVVDAIADGETGLVVRTRDGRALAGALARYLDDPELRRAHGMAGQRRVRDQFSNESVWIAWRDFYERLSDSARG